MSKRPRNELADALAELTRHMPPSKPQKLGTVIVDSGAVEFSFDGAFAGVAKLREKVFDLSRWTATVCYAKGRGACRTGWGDGPVEIWRYPRVPDRRRDDPCMGMPIHPPAGATFIDLGDCGKAQVRVEFGGEPGMLMVGWRGNRLCLSWHAFPPEQRRERP